MMARVSLSDKTRFNTSFAPLAVIGYCLIQADFFEPLRSGVSLSMRTRDYTPYAKLLDCLVSILAGCTAIQQINVRLRPDPVLAGAWDRTQFAEQSTIADTLDAFTAESVQQLREVNAHFVRRYSRALHHDFTQGELWLDVDLSPLPASRRAEGSTKGFVSGKKTRVVVNSYGSVHLHITRRCYHRWSLETPIVSRLFSQRCWTWNT